MTTTPSSAIPIRHSESTTSLSPISFSRSPELANTSASNSFRSSHPQTPNLSRSTSSRSISGTGQPILYQHHLNSPQKFLRKISLFSNKVTRARSRSRSSLSQERSRHDTEKDSKDRGPTTRKSSLGSTTSRMSTSVPQIAHSEDDTVISELEVRSAWVNMKKERRSIKIRLITFNMCERLPSGDLSEFLGDLNGLWKEGKWIGAEEITGAEGEERLPQYPLTESHPYHLIVVCGQESPLASGIMGGKIRNIDSRGWTSKIEEYLGIKEIVEDNSSPGDSNKERRGPYVLLEKERLMGLYIAVFVSTECNFLLKAVSKGRITAGLLGGRVGNKGAVGIAIDFAGNRIAFVSAHLAAHAKNLEIRKQNVRKILNELELDDFNGNKTELLDLSERFDQTFFLGDLNFRLAISRLHADFILKSQDYSTALLFDQLREVMLEEDSPFKGFQEASIKFAPTFKYDIVKPKSRKASRSKAPNSPTLQFDVQRGTDDETTSIGSDSSSISDSEQTGLDLEALGSPIVNYSEAVRKAKVKFLTLRAKSIAASRELGLLKDFVEPDGKAVELLNPKRPILKTRKSAALTFDSLEEGEVRAQPTFDTSSKQRVQSYTDRILFRSTVIPPSTINPPLVTSRKPGGAFSIKNFKRSNSTESAPSITTPHTYFEARPVIEHAPRKIEQHAHFSNLFGRHFNKSIESLVNKETTLSRARSMNSSPSKRVVPDSNSADQITGTSGIPSPSPPVLRPRSYSASAQTSFNLPSESPSHVNFSESQARRSNNSSSTTTNGFFPRSLTRTSARTTSNISRIKSFFHFNLPLPSFLSTTSSKEVTSESPVEDVGPQKGVIGIIKYDAISNLEKMGAISDHRPVFLVCAIGIGES